MESVSELAHEYCYRRNTQPDWSAVRVCWYRPTADVMPLWRRDVLDLCNLMETKRPLLVATVRKALSTLSDAELLELLAKDPTLAAMPEWAYDKGETNE